MAVGDRKILLTQTYADATFDRKDNITDDNNTYDSTKPASAKALAQLVDRVEILESSVGGTAQSYTLPVASSTTLGGVKIGAGLIMTNGVLSVTTTNGGSAVPNEVKYNYTATFGQTLFSAVYDVGHIEVFMNGIKLDASEYVAADGLSITLVSGCQAGDIINIVGYSFIATGASYTKTEIDARFADIASILDTINGEVI